MTPAERQAWEDDIRAKVTRLLDAVTGVATLCSQFVVEIGGHTDSRGADDYNLELSQRRAAAVMRYLTENGIEAGRLTSEGYGEARPIDTNDTDAGRARNRRVVFVILEQDENCGQSE